MRTLILNIIFVLVGLQRNCFHPIINSEGSVASVEMTPSKEGCRSHEKKCQEEGMVRERRDPVKQIRDVVGPRTANKKQQKYVSYAYD